MDIQCQFCQNTFRTPEERLPSAGTLVRCTHCRATFWVNPSMLPTQTPSAPSSLRASNHAIPTQSPPSSLPSTKSISPASMLPTGDPDSWWDLPEYQETQQQPGISLTPTSPPSPKDQNKDQAAPQTRTPDTAAPASVPSKAKPAAAKAKPVLGGWEPARTGSTAASNDPGDGPTKLTVLPFSTTGTSSRVEDPATLPTQRLQRPSFQLQTNTNTPPSNGAEEQASPSVEFLLRDRRQQRQELWFTLLPFVIRSLLVISFLFFFVWLWTSRERKHFSTQSLRWQVLRDTWTHRQSAWKLHDIRYQWRALNSNHFLVLQGKITNKHHLPLPEPRLQIHSVHSSGTQQSSLMACCINPTVPQLAEVHNRTQLQTWNRTHLGRTRKPLSPGQSKDFTLLWLPPSPVSSLRVLAVAQPKRSTLVPKTKAKTRKRSPPPRSEEKDLDED